MPPAGLVPGNFAENRPVAGKKREMPWGGERPPCQRGLAPRIPQQGVADGGKVDPYLVGAARLQAALHMGIPGIPGQDRPVGNGPPAVFRVDPASSTASTGIPPGLSSPPKTTGPTWPWPPSSRTTPWPGPMRRWPSAGGGPVVLPHRLPVQGGRPPLQQLLGGGPGQAGRQAGEEGVRPLPLPISCQRQLRHGVPPFWAPACPSGTGNRSRRRCPPAPRRYPPR